MPTRCSACDISRERTFCATQLSEALKRLPVVLPGVTTPEPSMLPSSIANMAGLVDWDCTCAAAVTTLHDELVRLLTPA